MLYYLIKYYIFIVIIYMEKNLDEAFGYGSDYDDDVGRTVMLSSDDNNG